MAASKAVLPEKLVVEEQTVEAVVAKGHPVVFLDVQIGDKDAGRLKIELFSSVVPKASENFRQLCTGEMRRSGVPVGYKGVPFHRVMAGFMVQGGDIVKKDGSGGLSIYGETFEDEKEGLELCHSDAGIVSMANSGPDSNSSQFFITTTPSPHLDGQHVVVGRLLDADSMLTLSRIEAVPTDGTHKPTVPCSIHECGEL